ncbi:MAG: hypothetical protein PHV49_06380 [Alistipes sp.]|nr:hypothetical protein [Alistipes sp.]
MNRWTLHLSLLLGVLGCHAITAAPVSSASSTQSTPPGIHAIGNGDLCLYGRNADIVQLFGAPYSSPNFFEMTLPDPSAYTVESRREPLSALWHHRIADPQGEIATLSDFVADSGSIFVRHIRAVRPLRYHIRLQIEAPYDTTLTLDRELNPVQRFTDSYGVHIAPNVPFYGSYKAPRPYAYQLLTSGSVSMTRVLGHPNELILSIAPGEGTFYVVGGATAAQLAGNLQRIEHTTPAQLQKQSLKAWKRYAATQSRLKGSALRPDQRTDFLQAIDDIAVLIKSQQDRSGGVLAGMIYHMGYVRDQYGVFRALLAQGHTREARQILDFYFQVWRQYGVVHNAQALGYPGIFHRHENDETEITGYLVVQAFDYYRKTGDALYIQQILPMLTWATEAQQRHIIDGMLPFNGDETYIAGGIVPRKVMYHGSAEATLLFIEGSRRLLDFVQQAHLWSPEQIASVERDVRQCSDRYRDNFFIGEKLYINNPARETKCTYPPTRPGVCLHPNHPLNYCTETFHYKGCLYFCKECMERGDTTGIALPEVERFNIPSANLFPFYIHATLFTEAERRMLLNQMIERYRTTGRISSVNRILGYDYGMFLYALASVQDPLSEEIYTQMMNLRDSAGAWVEYYVDGIPNGCRCRPWESGINIEAAILYAQ